MTVVEARIPFIYVVVNHLAGSPHFLIHLKEKGKECFGTLKNVRQAHMHCSKHLRDESCGRTDDGHKAMRQSQWELRLSGSTCRHSLLPTTAHVLCLSQMTALRSSKDSIPYLLAVPSALLLKIPAQMPVSGRSSDDLFWDEDTSLLEAGWNPCNLFCRTNFSRLYYNLFQSLWALLDSDEQRDSDNKEGFNCTPEVALPYLFWFPWVYFCTLLALFLSHRDF